MKCPRCKKDLSEAEIRSLWGQLSRSKASPLTPEMAKARAKKAAAARWAAGAGVGPKRNASKRKATAKKKSTTPPRKALGPKLPSESRLT